MQCCLGLEPMSSRGFSFKHGVDFGVEELESLLLNVNPNLDVEEYFVWWCDALGFIV